MRETCEQIHETNNNQNLIIPNPIIADYKNRHPENE